MAIFRYINILILSLGWFFSAAQIIYSTEEDSIRYSAFSCINLNGNNQYMATKSGVDFSAGSQFTIEAWFRPILTGLNPAVIVQKGAGVNGYKLELINGDSYSPYIRFQIGLGVDYVRADADFNTSPNSSDVKSEYLWHGFFYHIVCTYSGVTDTSGINIYINGVQTNETKTTGGSTPTIFTTDSLRVAHNGSTSYPMGIAIIREYDSVLSTSEIISLFNQGVPNRNTSINATTSVDVFNTNVFRNFTDENVVERDAFFPGALKLRSLTRADDKGVMEILGAGVFGDSPSQPATAHNHSPVVGILHWPNMIYDENTNKTYLSGIAKGRIWFSNAVIIGEYDHNSNTFTWTSRIPLPGRNLSDDHQQASILINNDSIIIIAHSRINDNSNTYTRHVSGQVVSAAGVVASQRAYQNIFSIADTIYTLCLLDDNSGQRLFSSLDNGAEWSSNGVIVQNDPSHFDDNTSYNHFTVHPKSDTVYIFVLHRVGVLGSNYWQKIAVYKTGDGVNYYNMADSLVGVIGEDYIDTLDIIGPCLIDSVSSNSYDIQLLAQRVDTTGNLHVIYRNEETDSIVYATWDGEWVFKNLPIPTDTKQTITPTSALIYKGAQRFDFFHIQTIDNYDMIVKYTTSDFFDTISSGEVISQQGRDYSQISCPTKQIPGKPVLIASNAIMNIPAETTRLFLYGYNPWQ